jgi:hypothetical protein
MDLTCQRCGPGSPLLAGVEQVSPNFSCPSSWVREAIAWQCCRRRRGRAGPAASSLEDAR